MTNFNFPDASSTDQLRSEIALLAAKMIAEEGAEYSVAKRKAAKQLLGNQKINGNILPGNDQIEQEVREYNALFFGDTQPIRLRHLRCTALRFMQEIERFTPYLTGAIMNGTAGEHSDIYLHLYTDNSKDVAIYLLNLGIDFEVSERQGQRNEPIETLSFLYQNEGVHLLVYDLDDLKRTDKKERISMSTLKDLLENETTLPVEDNEHNE